jgi:hypothetical protein
MCCSTLAWADQCLLSPYKLAQLHQLQHCQTTHLSVFVCPAGPCACAALAKLTFLSAGFNRRADVGKYLPASLLELQIGSAPHSGIDPGSDDEVDHYWDEGSYLPPVARGGSGQPFVYSLGHLTAVTSLDYLWEDQDDWEALYLGDVLPPNTVDLWAAVEHGAALAVLHPLTELTWLGLRHGHMQASQLQSLTVLRKLEVGARELCGDRGMEARRGPANPATHFLLPSAVCNI